MTFRFLPSLLLSFATVAGCSEGPAVLTPNDQGEPADSGGDGSPPHELAGAPDMNGPADLLSIVPTRLIFTVLPGDVLSGVQSDVEVAVVNEAGQVATASSCQITIGIGSNPSGGQLAGTTILATTAGRARFTDLRIDALGSGYRWRAKCAGFSDVDSQPFSVLASRLAVTVQPSPYGASGGAFIVVAFAVQDVTGRTDLNAQIPVTVGIQSGPAGAVLTGTLTTKTQNGVANFTNLRLDKAGHYRLMASATPEVLGVSTNEIDVFGTSLAFLDQPSSVVAGALISPSLRVAVTDVTGAVDSSVVGSISISSSGPCSVDNETATTTAGEAIFTNLRARRSGSQCTLHGQFNGSIGTGASGWSMPFDVSPGPPVTLTMLEFSSDKLGPNHLLSPIGVRISDAYGNWVRGAAATVTLALTSNTNGATLSGTLSSATSTAEAWFRDLSIDRTGTYRITASAPSLMSATSPPFTLTSWFRVSGHAAMYVDPTNANTVYGFNPSNPVGIDKSVDGGLTWTSRLISSYDPLRSTLAIDPLAPANLYAVAAGTVYRSSNGGVSWVGQFVHSSSSSASRLAISASMPSVLYLASGVSGLFRTTDAGSTWTKLPLGSAVTNAVIDPANALTVYVWGDGTGVFKSSNGGVDWLYASNGLPSDTTSIVIDPAAPTRLFATSPSGLFRSIDEGMTWSAVAAPPNYHQPLWLLFSPSDSTRLYGLFGSTSSANAAFTSPDGGATWVPWGGTAVPNIYGPPSISKSNPLVMYMRGYKTTTGGD